MTGFDSKRNAAQDKLTDEADTLTIVYQRGFADGKRSAERKPLTDQEIRRIKPVSPDFVDFRSGVRCAEAAHNIKENT